MDPLAANYNSAAVESDGTCQYSLVGEWLFTTYEVDSVNALLVFKSGFLFLDVLSNNSYRLYGESIASGQIVTTSGSAVTSGSNKSTLTLTDDAGTVDTYTITKINGSSVSFNGTNAGVFENIVLKRM